MSRPYQAVRAELFANEIGQELLARVCASARTRYRAN